MSRLHPPTAPTLDSLAAEPAMLESLPPSVLCDLYRQAARLEAELRALLLTAKPEPEKQADQILTIREAADLLRVSLDSLHRKWRALPFAFKDPVDGRLKFSRCGAQRYV